MPDDFESYDEDNIGLDPLEEGMDPPERWAQADKFGNTEREGEDLNHRLAQEQPDLSPEPPQRPLGATPEAELDESIDDETDDVDPIAPDDPHRPEPDQAGDSVAEALRAPPPD